MTADTTNRTTSVYIFVGPEKTGTTTIFEMLPFAKIPRQKETFNLSRRQDASAERDRIAWQAADQTQVFLVEPTYFTSDFALATIGRMQESYDVHVVHTRRDPVARTLSHYLHHKLKGRVKNPSEAVQAYPEIVTASDYDHHTSKWQAAVCNVHVIDIAQVDLRQALKDIGIAEIDANVLHANAQLAPRSLWLSKFSTLIWDAMITMRLNLLVPRGVKVFLKNRIYYGGKRIIVTDQEREYLTRCLSITH